MSLQVRSDRTDYLKKEAHQYCSKSYQAYPVFTSLLLSSLPYLFVGEARMFYPQVPFFAFIVARSTVTYRGNDCMPIQIHQKKPDKIKDQASSRQMDKVLHFTLSNSTS